MPSGFGGQSQSIYKRVLKKVYGPEKGIEVASDLFTDPVAVIPVVLARLKQKDEEWRFTHVSPRHLIIPKQLLTFRSVSGTRCGMHRLK